MEKIDCFGAEVLAFQTNAFDGNLATHTGDDLEKVLKNRLRLQKKLTSESLREKLPAKFLQEKFTAESLHTRLPSEPLWLRQNHGIDVTDSENFDADADAIISDKKNCVLAILTADCLPILIAGKNEIAAIHAGWRGLAGNIVENTFWNLKENPASCTVFLGVCIQNCCFEVGSDVVKAFTGFESAFSTVDGKFFLNLQKIARLKLLEIGVLKENILHDSTCTACDARFFSYRKTKTIARQATLIWKI